MNNCVAGSWQSRNVSKQFTQLWNGQINCASVLGSKFATKKPTVMLHTFISFDCTLSRVAIHIFQSVFSIWFCWLGAQYW